MAKKNKKRVQLYKRKWLNPKTHSDLGAIKYKVHHDGGTGWVAAEVDIWDCGRKITLDFDCHNKRDAKNRTKKLDILIESLQEMKVHLNKALDYDDVFEYDEEDDD